MYNEIIGDRQKRTMATRSAARGMMVSVYAASRTMVASYQEPLEIPEGKQISEQDAEII